MAGCWGDDGKWHDECSGSSDAYPANGTAAEQSKWLKDHGYGNGTNDTVAGLTIPGWVINPTTGGLIPPGPGATGGGGIPIGAFFDVNGTVYQWNGHGNPVQATVSETKSYWNQHPNGLSYNSAYGLLDAGGQGATNSYGGGSAGSGGSGSSTRLASDDPRYWDFQYAQLASQDKQAVDQLAFQYTQLGQTGENARRSALMAFIQARDSLSANTAQTSANVAKQIADYAANPRDTYAEAIYRNQVGGSTPFGDLNNSAFGEYGKALAQKGVNIFQNVAGDLDASRRYRDALPLQDWLPADLRGSTNAGQSSGGPAASAPAGAAGPSAQDLINAYNAYHPNAQMPGTFYGFNSPEEAQAMSKYFAAKQAASPTPINGGSTLSNATPQLNIPGSLPMPSGGSYGTVDMNQPKAYAKGGTLNFDGMFSNRANAGYSPSSSEGGTQLNIHERAVIVGESGHVYGTLGEKRPDGSVRAEQLQIKPLKSEVAKDKRLEEGNKAVVESQKKTMASFAGGGSVTSDPSLDEMNQQYSALLVRLGGSGGGSDTPYGGARFLAGAPANMIAEDPYLKGITEAGYSMRGVDPSELWAQVAKFQIQGPQNNSPRVSFA